MNAPSHRRDFLRQLALYTMGAGMVPTILAACNNGQSTKESGTSDSTAATKAEALGTAKSLFFKISLAEWSFHRALFAKQMTHLDFPVKAKKRFRH